MASVGVDTRSGAALSRLEQIPAQPLFPRPTPVEEMARLRAALGGGPRLLVKRDDAIPFGFGGNKVRKAERVIAEALRLGADTLVTTGGVQSNHARVIAAAAAKLGLGCVLVANGTPPRPRTANALLAALLGADIEYVGSRAARQPAMVAAVARLRSAGRKPYLIPLGASTPLGALAFISAVGELLEQIPAPDVIVHATSSGGTQAGLVLGCALHGLRTRVLGISADDSAAEIEALVGRILSGAVELLEADPALMTRCEIAVDDRFVGDGYGISTDASREAQQLAARREALFVDHTYSAKALAGLIAHVRAGSFRAGETVLFWHTGGQVGLFA